VTNPLSFGDGGVILRKSSIGIPSVSFESTSRSPEYTDGLASTRRGSPLKGEDDHGAGS
jgi:hypothetical protein